MKERAPPQKAQRTQVELLRVTCVLWADNRFDILLDRTSFVILYQNF